MARKKTAEEPQIQIKEEEVLDPILPIENDNIKIEKFSSGSDAKRFYDFYAKQPRRTTFIPLNPGELFGTEHAVLHIQVNDLKLKVRKGVPVELPEELARIAEESVMSQNRAMYETKLAKTYSGVIGGSIGGSGNVSARIDQQGATSKQVLS